MTLQAEMWKRVVKEYQGKVVIDIKPDSICSYIRRHNKASIRVSEKIGMERLLEYKTHGIENYLYGYSRAYFQ